MVLEEEEEEGTEGIKLMLMQAPPLHWQSGHWRGENVGTCGGVGAWIDGVGVGTCDGTGGRMASRFAALAASRERTSRFRSYGFKCGKR
jgi:hypothetical protein